MKPALGFGHLKPQPPDMPGQLEPFYVDYISIMRVASEPLIGSGAKGISMKLGDFALCEPDPGTPPMGYILQVHRHRSGFAILGISPDMTAEDGMNQYRTTCCVELRV
jgi:hypothetical protein